jgi:long-subunit acyl-CoA synthetase (AMP-forming)
VTGQGPAGLLPAVRASGRVLGDGVEISHAGLVERAARLAAALPALGATRLGLLADNGPDWLAADLAAQLAGVPIVPLPLFFTPEQMRAALDGAGVDLLLTDRPGACAELGFARALAAASGSLGAWARAGEATRVTLPAGTGKVTFTSGTTGRPKGVCLSNGHVWRVAGALAGALEHVHSERHLCALPLPVLLENIAGGYVSWLTGATLVVPPLASLGLAGAAGLDVAAFAAAVERWQPHSLILLPQMLKAWVAALEGGLAAPASLRFVAVGGGKVATATLLRARQLGLPVYEGYGLSECASVVALNVPGADRPGSVGRALPHVRLSLSPEHEILVEGERFLGYLGDGASAPSGGPLATGDLGAVGADGFVSITGRRKNIYITSFGRNVSPEWPEAELAAEPVIAQAAVFGEAEPQARAVLVPAAAGVDDAALAAAVRRANRRLPDYARIARWVRAAGPFTPANGLATANGRPRREAIHALHAAALAAAIPVHSEGAEA